MIIADPLDSIQIYLSKTQKQEFKKMCKLRQSTMAAELRRFIRAYINTPWHDDRVYYAPVKTSP